MWTVHTVHDTRDRIPPFYEHIVVVQTLISWVLAVQTSLNQILILKLENQKSLIQAIFVDKW